jgi:hypothetical protein
MWESFTEEQKSEIVSKAAKTREKNGTTTSVRKKYSWKSSWEEIEKGKRFFFRSSWEVNYAYYLQYQKEKGVILDWDYEPVTFWFEGIKRGCVSYLPDFRIINLDGTEEFHEVKGWMDDRSKTKIKRMGKYHPNVKLVIIDGKEYRRLHKALLGVIPGWEKRN